MSKVKILGELMLQYKNVILVVDFMFSTKFHL